MKKTIRSAIALVLTVSMAIPLAACSSKNNKKTKKKVVSENDPYYEAAEKELKVNYDASKEIETAQLYNYQIIGDSIAAVYYISYKMPADVQKKMDKMNLENEKDYEEWMKIYEQYSENGTVFFNFDLEEVGRIKTSTTESINRFFEGPNGEILALVTQYTKKKTEDNLMLVEFSQNGEKVKETKFSDALSDVWDSTVKFLPDGRLLVISYSSLYLLDGTGKKLGEIKNEDFNGSVLEQDGKLYAITQKWNAEYTSCTTTANEIDLDNFAFVNPVELKEYAVDGVFSGRDGNYTVDTNSISKVDILGKKDKEVILDWNDTDIIHNDIYSSRLCIRSSDEIYMFREEYIDAKNKSGMETKIYMTKLSRKDKNPNAGKQIIEMGCNGMPSDQFQKYIIQYNTDPSKKSRIILHDYSSDVYAAYLKNGEKAVSEVLNTLYLDMLSHSGPDILYDFASCSQFNNEKILLDLNTCIDGANGLSRDKYFDNVFRSFEINNKLYQIPLTFYVEGYVANKDVVGDRDSWTYAEFDQVFSNLPDKMSVFDSYYSRKDMLGSFLDANLYDFIDYDQKKVSFDGESFMKLLEICKKYGNEEIAYDDPMLYQESVMSEKIEDEDKFENDLIAMDTLYLSGFREYMETLSKRKGKVTIIGAPSDGKSGLGAYATCSLAISAASDYKEDAWDFIRFLFEEEMQKQLCDYAGGFPIHRDAFTAMAKAEIDEYNEDKKRWKENPEEFYDFDGNDPYPLDMKESDIDSLRKTIERITKSIGADQVVMDVVNEEVAAFFAGQRPADQIAKIIQDKVKTIVNER